jgi:hypothetical protein
MCLIYIKVQGWHTTSIFIIANKLLLVQTIAEVVYINNLGEGVKGLRKYFLNLGFIITMSKQILTYYSTNSFLSALQPGLTYYWCIIVYLYMDHFQLWSVDVTKWIFLNCTKYELVAYPQITVCKVSTRSHYPLVPSFSPPSQLIYFQECPPT